MIGRPKHLRGTGWSVLLALLLWISSGAIVLAGLPSDQQEPHRHGVTSDKPALVLTEEPVTFTCPMHPQVRSEEPAGSCPICGMDLVAMRAAEPSAGSSDAEGPDTAPITVSPEMLQTMGVRTAVATVAPFGRTVRAFGTVENNQRLETVSVSRLEGWIQSLKVRAAGDRVVKGDLLYRIYSPVLLTAQRDFVRSMAGDDTQRQAAIQQRLLSLGMQERAIERLKETGEVVEAVPVFAESSGVVTELAIREGDYVKPGDPILRLQTYSEVWVIAQLAEQDLPFVQEGLAVRLAFPSAPGAPTLGSVEYIYPTIDPTTRTGQLRVVVNNPSGALRPGAYADVTIKLSDVSRLTVPSEAVLLDSRGAHIVLALGSGRFAGRQVKTGLIADGRTEITAGLVSGDRVVTSAQFLLDSEINLREGLDKFEPPEADPHAGHRH